MKEIQSEQGLMCPPTDNVTFISRLVARDGTYGDVSVARTPIDKKRQLRSLELGYANSHLARRREGRIESIESSSLSLDVLCNLKSIHSHLSALQDLVLEPAGELQPNRLKESDTGTTRDVSNFAPIPPG
jgi:phosphate:Na+ symporter